MDSMNRSSSLRVRYRGSDSDVEAPRTFVDDEHRKKLGQRKIRNHKKTIVRALVYFIVLIILYRKVASIGLHWKASKAFYVDNKDLVRSKETLLTNEANVILHNQFLKHKHRLDRMDEYVDIDLCVGVITNFQRENLINVTMASLLVAMKEDEKDQKHRKLRKRIYMFHDTEKFSKNHWHVRRYPFATHQSVYGTTQDEFLDRQRWTYAESLQRCLDTYAEYILIFEDDVFVSPTMFSDLREQNAYETLSMDRKNLATHLFISEIVDNDWNPSDIMRITVSSCTFLLSWWALSRALSSVPTYSNRRRVAVIIAREILHVLFFSTACFTLLCAKYLRRPYFFPKIIEVRDRGYPNAVANLYDSSRLCDIRLVEYLRSPQTMGRPVDLAMNDFTMELDMHQRVFYPNPVQHMGCRSTYVKVSSLSLCNIRVFLKSFHQYTEMKRIKEMIGHVFNP